MDREHGVWTGAPVVSSYPKVGSHSPSNKHAETRQRPPGRQAARPSRICLGVPGQTNRDASSSSEPRISEPYIWAERRSHRARVECPRFRNHAIGEAGQSLAGTSHRGDTANSWVRLF
jgi:hypothetical protein